MIYAFSIDRTTDSTSEPISLTDAKKHLRIDHNDDDGYISTLIGVARQSVEISTGRALGASQTYVAGYQYLPYGYDRLVIPRPPFVSVTSLKYFDQNQSLVEITSSKYEIDDAGNNCALLAMTDSFSYPTLSVYKEARVLLTYEAGSSSIPKPLHQAMLLLISHYYDTREPVAFNATPMKVPRSVDFLCNQYKIRRG